MTFENIEQIVETLIQTSSGLERNELEQTRRLIETCKDRHFNKYAPQNDQDFDDRLKGWLENVSNIKSKKTLYRIIRKLFFAGDQEFKELMRIAYENHVWPWLFNLNNLSFFQDDLKDRMKSAVKTTWFCGITDSFPIGPFHNSHNIRCNINTRPDWLGLSKAGDKDRIIDLINENNIECLVLLEDFVGTGGQAKKPLNYALSIFNSLSLPVLFVPLIIGSSGDKFYRNKAKSSTDLTYSPVLILGKDSYLKPEAETGEDPFNQKIRDLVLDKFEKITEGKTIDKYTPPYSPFGWKKDGALFVMHSNCPDNTLPIINFPSGQWRPIFERNIRE